MENKKDNKIEYVYVLTNPAMPEYVKVGRTNNIERRIKDLSKDTSVPLPFECYAYLCVYGGGETSATVEKSLHFYLGEKYTKNKELSADDVVQLNTPAVKKKEVSFIIWNIAISVYFHFLYLLTLSNTVPAAISKTDLTFGAVWIIISSVKRFSGLTVSDVKLPACAMVSVAFSSLL